MEATNNKKLSRIVVIAAITLIQGILYFVISLWALLIIQCRFQMTSTNLGTIMYFIYFRNADCGEVVWSRLRPVMAEMPSVTFVAERTEGIVIFYLALSGLWIITSGLVIGGALKKTLDRRSFHMYFTPWAIMIIAGSVLDVIATAFHIFDICNTANAEDTLRFLEVENIWEILESVEGYYRNFNYPSIIFTCVSSRLVVIFLLNIFGMLWVIKQAARRVISTEEQRESLVRPPMKPMDNPMQLPNDPSQYYYVPTRVLPPIVPFPGDPYRRSFEPLKSGGSSPINIPQELYLENAGANMKQKRVKLPKNASNNNVGDVVMRGRRLDPSNTYQPPEIRYASNMQQQYDPAFVNMQQRVMYTEQPERPTSQNFRVSDELRSQLPWSYFNARDDLSSPRRALTHVDNHEVLPPVPVPDYTLHFPKKERYSVKDPIPRQQSRPQMPPGYDQNAPNRW